uniref:Uncharacterized protein n=1 Tax=Aegilops tauschii subsp. strangulata TaxID=200361 RepID=A0A453TD41_AEGTS
AGEAGPRPSSSPVQRRSPSRPPLLFSDLPPSSRIGWFPPRSSAAVLLADSSPLFSGAPSIMCC